MEFRIARLEESSVFSLYLNRDAIWLDPPYQRMADIWPLEKKQLLIDSLLNGFDVPKFYFHDFYPGKSVDAKEVRFAIIDGKQRLGAIWDFIDGKYALSDDIELLNSPEIDVRGLTYGELGASFPKLKATLDSRQLVVVTILAEEVELIEEMFSRLNEAVPLSAAEKRNAFGGPIPAEIRSLVKHPFFVEDLPFPNTRYRHFDLACKFLYLVDEHEIVDLKKVRLDEFVKGFRNRTAEEATTTAKKVAAILDNMASSFTETDQLLGQVGMTTLLFILYAGIEIETGPVAVPRSRLSAFEYARKKNREIAEDDVAKANYALLEFDRYSQSPNDELALRYRCKVLLDWLAAN